MSPYSSWYIFNFSDLLAAPKGGNCRKKTPLVELCALNSLFEKRGLKRVLDDEPPQQFYTTRPYIDNNEGWFYMLGCVRVTYLLHVSSHQYRILDFKQRKAFLEMSCRQCNKMARRSGSGCISPAVNHTYNVPNQLVSSHVVGFARTYRQ